jgi:hypothetical protein
MTLYITAERSYTGVETVEFTLDMLPERWEYMSDEAKFVWAESNAKSSAIISDSYIETESVSNVRYWK